MIINKEEVITIDDKFISLEEFYPLSYLARKIVNKLKFNEYIWLFSEKFLGIPPLTISDEFAGALAYSERYEELKEVMRADYKRVSNSRGRYDDSSTPFYNKIVQYATKSFYKQLLTLSQSDYYFPILYGMKDHEQSFPDPFNPVEFISDYELFVYLVAAKGPAFLPDIFPLGIAIDPHDWLDFLDQVVNQHDLSVEQRFDIMNNSIIKAEYFGFTYFKVIIEEEVKNFKIIRTSS
jgi:hypothetical protein